MKVLNKEVLLEEAKLLTENWQQKHLIKAFLFHREELFRIISNDDAKFVRFYMGQNGVVIHMLIVGVDELKRDIVIEGPHSGVFDFALPCPSTCDLTSPLFHVNERNEMNAISGVNQTALSIKGINLAQELSYDTAVNWTREWQENHDVKSFLFDVEQLESALNKVVTIESNSVTRLRIYFGLKGEEVCAIIIGINETGVDIPTEVLQVNECSACGLSGDSETTCDVTSPLYHSV